MRTACCRGRTCLWTSASGRAFAPARARLTTRPASLSPAVSILLADATVALNPDSSQAYAFEVTTTSKGLFGTSKSTTSLAAVTEEEMVDWIIVMQNGRTRDSGGAS